MAQKGSRFRRGPLLRREGASMKKAKLTVHPSFRIGAISPRLFGAFLEPIGSMVNGSMYNPKHPTADRLGMRRDFMDALRASGLPSVRLPGGNFVSGWNWKDSIGPREQRKTHLDLAWHQFIPNDVGHDEYLQWAEGTGAQAMYTVNLGTGTLNDAADAVEYTNFAGGTYWSDLRRKNGHAAPYQVKTWYLGNEMDGPWQIASWEKNPAGYGVLAHETSKAMKFIDPTIETAACVSSSPFLSHYPEWDRKVLEECYETVDYISMHHYHSAPIGNIAGLLAGYQAFEQYIQTEIGLCDYIKTKLRVRKTMMLSLDEYGAMMRPAGKPHFGMNGRTPAWTFYSFDPDQQYVRHDPDDWSTRRRFPAAGEMPRVLGTCSVLLTLLRHADRVKIGCATGGLGDLCMTDREHVWKGAAHYPFTQMIRWATGDSLLPVVECEKYQVEGYIIDDMNQYEGFENVNYIQAAAALNREGDELTVFVINADWEEKQAFTLDVRGFEGWTFLGHSTLYSDDPDACNTFEHPDTLLPRNNPGAAFEKGVCTAVLPKLSWNVFRFRKG